MIVYWLILIEDCIRTVLALISMICIHFCRSMLSCLPLKTVYLWPLNAR